MRAKKAVCKPRGPSVVLRITLAATLVLLGVSACELMAPAQPKASCSSDPDCEANGRGDRFCIQGHCVQCLTSESCNGDDICFEGVCYTPCKVARDCPSGRACTDGFCAAP